MRIPLFSLIFSLAYMGAVLLADDYLKLREEIAYIKVEGALKAQKEGNKFGSRGDRRGGADPEQGRDKEPENRNLVGWALSFLATLIAGIVYLEQRDKARRELRAYLGIKEAKIVEIGPKRFQLQLLIENSSKTPAKRIRMFLGRDVFDSGYVGPFNIGPLRGKWPLGPNASRTIRSVLPELDKENHFRIARDREVVVWGRIEYWDIYETMQWVEFRLHTRETATETKVNDDQGRISVTSRITGWALQPTQDGNDAS